MASRRWSFWMPPLEHRMIRVLDDWHRCLLTPMGRVLLWGAAASGFILLGGFVPLQLYVFGFCLSALACALVLGFVFRPRVTLSRRLPPPASAGEVMSYSVLVENRGRRVLRDLVIDERALPPELRPVGEAPVIERLGPKESAPVTLRLSCQTRGAFELKKVQAASSFPAGLVKVGRGRKVRERVLVYPKFSRLERFEIPHGRNYQPGGLPIASKVGESCEFFGSREWREGDLVRDIHWPSLARTGRLIVREFQEEYFVRLAMVLDIEARTRRDEALFEKSLSLAAAIADVLARQEYIVDLFAAGPQVYRFQAGRALAHFENILEILACLSPGDRLDMGALEAAILPEAPQLSAVVLVMMDWDERRAALVRALKERGVAVRVLCMRSDRRPQGLDPSELVELP
ncbi:MAG: DUF58 domain-containing protein [Deltaproteobacteria bacterium]|nr:DUF58 domain-containing protein [Deltaproteobacteria bacterium]